MSKTVDWLKAQADAPEHADDPYMKGSYLIAAAKVAAVEANTAAINRLIELLEKK